MKAPGRAQTFGNTDTLQMLSPILQTPNLGAFMFWQLNLSVSRTGEKRAVSPWAGGVTALVWAHRRAGFGVTWGGVRWERRSEGLGGVSQH